MLLDELGVFLQQQGHGILGTTLFRGKLPMDAPGVNVQDSVTALIPLSGEPPQRTHAGERYTVPHVRIDVRGAQYGEEAALAKAQAIWEDLDGVTNQVLSGVRYLSIFALNNPFPLRIDELGRPIVIFHIRCARAL